MDFKDKLYRDVTESTRAGDFSAACNAVAKLLEHRAEFNRILAFLIDLYLSADTWDRSVSTNVEIIQTYESIASLPKRQLQKNTHLRGLLNKLVSYCLSVKPWFEDRDKYVVDIDMGRVVHKLENVLMCCEAYGESSIVSKHLRGRMTSETAHLFDALYYFMRRGDRESRKISGYMAAHILGLKEVTFDRVPDNELFDDVKDDCKVDIIWYLWWFIILYCKKLVKQSKNDREQKHWQYCNALVQALFNIFKLGYVKKLRAARLGVPLRMLAVMMRDRAMDLVPHFQVHELGLLPEIPIAASAGKSSSIPASNSDTESGGEVPEVVPAKPKRQPLQYFDYVIYSED